MAATTSKKGGKSSRRRRSFLCSFAACFGISNKVSTDHADKKSLSARHPPPDLPVNGHHIPPEIVKSTKEIHVVEDDDDAKKTTIPFPSTNELIITPNKRDDIIISEKSKKGEESIFPIIKNENSSKGNDTWTNRRKLSHSVSLPAAVRQEREKPAERGKGEAAAVGGEFDSTVGAVIVSVTLVVMIIWGKVCAVVCTAAWFYFVPRFRAKMEKSMELRRKGGDGVDLDLDSWEYKKKVVLEGLLHRNHNL